MEVPGFNEHKLKRLGTTQYKTKRITFSREEALKKAPPHIVPILEDLFAQIDRTELMINYYEIEKGKRTTPPREELLNRVPIEVQEQAQQAAAKLNGRTYLQARHHLVQLRTEQYTYGDSIKTTLLPHVEGSQQEEDFTRFDTDIPVLPLGLFDDTDLAAKIFTDPIIPESFTEEELQIITKRLWAPPSKIAFDFRNPDHVFELYKLLDDFKDDEREDPDQLYNAAGYVARTLQYYEQTARLADFQRDILRMKLEGQQNVDIAHFINDTYGTTYNINYISTIYRQKIIPTIANAASLHLLVMQNIFYPENFRVCKECGKPLLVSPEFYMRQQNTRDGFALRCKQCQKQKQVRLKLQSGIKFKH